VKLLLLIGDAAVGKMTVGQELAKITKLKLFHNHMTIEPVIELFGGFRAKTTVRLRDVIFDDFAADGSQYGMIHTFMWAFDEESDWNYAAGIANTFAERGAEVYYAELDAPLGVRLARNVTENRLLHKLSKRDLAASNARVVRDSEAHRLVSLDGELQSRLGAINFLRIENSDVPPDAAARLIKDRFGFE
jgi:hypothetical protein